MIDLKKYDAKKIEKLREKFTEEEIEEAVKFLQDLETRVQDVKNGNFYTYDEMMEVINNWK